MGIPVTAAYLITSELAVPILTTPEMGIPIIAAHLIIFWLSQDSNITPPVALGAYAGAAIARADPWKTGWTCFKFAKLLYIMPLLFAYTHILFTGAPLQNALSVVTAVFGTIIFSIVTMGYFIRKTRWYEWGVLALAAFLAYIYNIWTFIVAIVLVTVVYFIQKGAFGAFGVRDFSMKVSNNRGVSARMSESLVLRSRRTNNLLKSL